MIMKKLLLLLIFIPSLLISQSIENFGNSEKTYYENGNLFSEKINNTKNNSTGHIVYWEDGKTKMGEFQFDQKGSQPSHSRVRCPRPPQALLVPPQDPGRCESQNPDPRQPQPKPCGRRPCCSRPSLPIPRQ